jgi:hypothetical protein
LCNDFLRFSNFFLDIKPNKNEQLKEFGKNEIELQQGSEYWTGSDLGCKNVS